MNWLDLVLILIIFLSITRGFRFGLVNQVVGLAGCLLAFFLALRWNSGFILFIKSVVPLEQIISNLIQGSPVLGLFINSIIQIIGFIILFSMIKLAFSIVSSKLLAINSIPVIGVLNRVIGGIIGAIKGLIVVFLIVILLSIIPTPFGENCLRESVVANFMFVYLGFIYNIIIDLVHGNFGL